MHQKDLDLPRLFEVLVPTVTFILRETKPSMIGNSGENVCNTLTLISRAKFRAKLENLKQKFRKLLIEVLLRLPHAEPLRQYTPSLISLLLHLLRTENEENAVLCMKTIIDLHRTYSRPPPPHPPNPDGTPSTLPPDQTVSQMEASVDEFLEIVAELFKNMGSVVEETFKDSSNSAATRSTRSSTTAGGGGGGGGAESSQSPAGPPALEADGSAVTGAIVHQPAMRSFKLLQDCPASIVFIFQTYRPMVNKAITIFVPLVFDVSSFHSCPLTQFRLSSLISSLLCS